MSASTSKLVSGFLGSSEPVDSPTIVQLPAELAQLIATHQANLLDVVKASGEYLTSEDDKRRGRGISLLARVVTKCPKEAVTRQETRTLADFFISCISDPLSEDVFVPTLEGLTTLAKLPHFGPLEATSLCKAIFRYVDLHGRPQTTRFLVYRVIDALMAHRRPALQKMGKDFVSGYCQLVTGEKDPRNLRLAFSIERVMLVEFDIAENVEDLFDITFCYFPITFTPPPNDPYGITSEELQASLRACLAATPRFGTLALPLFLEKLQASTTSAKRQSLQALVACFPVYGRAVILPHAETFWEAISVEIFHATDAETEELALQAVKVLFSTLYPDDAETSAITQDKSANVLNKMRDACFLELKSADKSNATPATRILCQAISATGVLARDLVPQVFDHLVKIWKLPDEAHQRPALFQVMSRVIEALQDCPSPLGKAAFDPYREEVLSLAASNLITSKTQEQALACLSALARSEDCLTKDELVFAVQTISDLLVSPPESGNDEIAAAALDSLDTIAAVHPGEIQEVTLPGLFQLLPDTAPRKEDDSAISNYRLGLAALATLCRRPALFEALLIRLLTRVDILGKTAVADRYSLNQTIQYLHHILTTLKIVIEKKAEAGHQDFGSFASRVVHRLFSLFVGVVAQNTDSDGIPAKDTKILSDAGKIVTLLVQQMDERSQRALFADLQSAYVDGQITALIGPAEIPSGRREAFAPFSIDSPSSVKHLLILYAHALFAARKEVLDSSAQIKSICDSALSALSVGTRDILFEVLSKLLASLANKKAEILDSFVQDSLSTFYAAFVADTAKPASERRKALLLWAWVMRGLVIRGDNRAYTGIARILDLFGDADLSKDAARSMIILSREQDGVISKENFAVIRLLHRQRLYSTIIPKLVQGFHASEANAGSAYLIGLSCLLQCMPKQTSMAELPKLLPLLLKALHLPELDLRANVVDTLALLVKDSPETIKGQADAIVADLLKNAICDDPTHDTDAGANLRISALKCLTVFPDSLDWLTLHQQRQPVLRMLGRAVDDPKKRVRKEAVDCRARWYLFKAP